MNAIAKALRAVPDHPLLLAVSGGPDSMAMLHAFWRLQPGAIAAVATYDHGTGVAAAEAVELVIRECLARSIPVVAGRAPETSAGGRPAEAVLRESRWRFLRAVAEERRAAIATAHTWDDQAETVAMRILRGASARGLAAMAAPTLGVVRPLLSVRRAELAKYLRAERVPWVHDPSNADRAYLRNRLRADLLAAAERVRPGFAADLVAIGERAAAWRELLRATVDDLGVRQVGGAVVVPVAALGALGAEALMIVWPECAARAGVTLDRRGVERLSAWSAAARPGQHIPLSSGARVERTAHTFVVRRELGVGPPTILMT